jgi:PAS domain S-box-containing protein
MSTIVNAEGKDARLGESAFAAAVRDSHLAMVVVDANAPDLPVIFVNRAFTALTGYAAEDVIGRNCRFMRGPGTDPADVETIRQVLREQRVEQVDILNYRKDGSAFWNALHLSPVRDAEGRTTHFFGALADVTDRKRAEAELKAVREGLEDAVETRAHELKAALEQKTALLHEVDHRVKNNLQLIASLIMLQIRRTPEAAAKQALRSMLARVSAVSTAHRRLFQNQDVERFEVGVFLRDLVDDRFGLNIDDEALELDIPDVTLPNARAASLALVVSEMLNHVLDPEADELALKMQATRDGGELRISLEGRADLGDGDPFGREIVDLLARQLQGKARLEEQNGLRRAYLLLPLDGT